MGAVLIEGGCKWCGKSTTARQFAKSYIEFQDPDKKMQYDKIVQTKPSIFLEGEKPRLFDEWQMYPVVWDSIRMDVDHTGLNGQYIRVQQDQQKIAWRTAARAKSLNY